MLNRVGRALREEVTASPIPFRTFVALFLADRLPYISALRLRTALYRLGGVRIGHGTVLMGPLRLWGRARLTIGRDCVVNAPGAINLEADVTLGDRVFLGNDVLILTYNHILGTHGCRAGGGVAAAPVTVEEGCWIGARATLLPGVIVGAGSVVAAGSVVTRDVPPDTLVGGVPARTIRTLGGPDGDGDPSDPSPLPDLVLSSGPAMTYAQEALR